MVKTTYGTEILALYSVLFWDFFSSTNCEMNTTKDPRIIGGTHVTDRSQFAYQALLLQYNVPCCGGTIINENHVLTAAHCIPSPPVASSVTVVVGNLKLNDQTILKRVQKIYVHKGFTMETLQDDIALLKMLDGFGTPTSKVRPINLKTDKTTDGVCIVSGFGITENGAKAMNSELMYVEVPIVEWKTCNMLYSRFKPITVNTICASAIGKDSCTGDSGGPLVCSGKLAGIVSFGPSMCASKFPGVYTDVAQYLGWIKEHGGYNQRAYTEDDTATASSTPPPSLAVLLHRYVPRCGGTIITEKHVLTAAHCIPPSPVASSVMVVVGNLKLDDQSILKRVQKIYVHKNFTMKTLQDDIALLKMLDGFGTSTSKVRPINLKTDETTDDVCILSGFGIRINGAIAMNSKLMYVEAPVLNWINCKEHYSRSRPVSVKTICASAVGTDSCYGDSGGPLVCSDRLAGIVSFGPNKCGVPNSPGVFTDVAQYLGWIKQHGGYKQRTTYTEDDTATASSTPPPSLVLNFMSLLAIFIFKIIRNF